MGNAIERPIATAAYAERGDSAVVVTGESGNLLSASELERRLMFLSSNVRVAQNTIRDDSAEVNEPAGMPRAAQLLDARERRREAIRRIEGLHCVMHRHNVSEALRHWERLISGRWSFIDKFASDDRCFLVGARNDPHAGQQRGLTKRERQIADLVGLGNASNQIAYTLGISETAVTNCTGRVQHKLGLASRTELVAFFAHNGLRRKLTEVSVADENLLIGVYSLVSDPVAKLLSLAERTIAGYVVAGRTNRDIARARGTSAHTIANQIQAIFRKLHVRSRGELVARLQQRG